MIISLSCHLVLINAIMLKSLKISEIQRGRKVWNQDILNPEVTSKTFSRINIKLLTSMSG